MSVQNRRDFLKSLALGAAAVSLPGCALGVSTARASEKQTNILLIMIDDLGWMDLRCQGNERLDTPNIDRLASQGMRFTDFYAAAPVCSPTRAAIMTGQSPARLGLTNHAPDRASFAPKNAKLLSAETLDYLPLNHVTIAERLKEAGYATGFFGKWHLSGKKKSADGPNEPDLRPEYQGFDVNIGGCSFGGPPTYFDPYRIPSIENRRKGEYLPDRLADETVEFMRAHREGPFFVALWNYTVHWPMEAPEDLVDKYERRLGPGLKDARYGAMIEAMDAAMGRVFAVLDELKLGKQTLVIFASDNGGFAGVCDNRPLRASKGHLYEGGIRVPLIVRWPGVVRGNTICRTPVVSTDFYPTVLDAAGLFPGAGKTLDGESIMPLLKGTGGLRRSAICFHYPNYAWHGANRLGGAIREGDYKLIERYEDDSVELFNLAEDLSEKNDLAEKMPKRAAELKRKLDAWLRECGAKMPTRI
ncbi:MAG: sulfatase-like hydrolase/transferase [Phycisphaerae bacterium]|nr:sulfatase-like hydrolase/transferase [Phycisphaerae bacterium]